MINISCGTYPTSLCHSLRLVGVSFLPSISISPEVGGKKPSIRLKRVDLPVPLAPRIPIRSPQLIFRFKPLNNMSPSGKAKPSPRNSSVYLNVNDVPSDAPSSCRRPPCTSCCGSLLMPSSTTAMVCEAFCSVTQLFNRFLTAGISLKAATANTPLTNPRSPLPVPISNASPTTTATSERKDGKSWYTSVRRRLRTINSRPWSKEVSEV